MKKLAAPALLVGTLLVAFAAAELLLRLGGYSAPIWYQPDAQLGWGLRPGAQGWYTREGRVYAQINVAGFRDREHVLAKPAGTYRIALLGDSVAEAFQVDVESSFWWLVQEKLRNCPALAGRDVEVVNFGVSGFGTAQEALQLESTAIRYQPDLVLLAFAPNDLRNNSMRLESDRERPFYVLEAGELRLDMSFVRTREFQQRASARYEAYRSASDRLRVVQLVQATRQSLQHWGGGAAQADPGRARKPIPGVEPGADVQVFAPPRDAAWLEAWTITEKLIARMNAFSSSNGARFAVALLTHSAQVDPDPSVRKHLADALGVDDLFYVEQRLRAFGERERIPVIALASELQKRADAEQVHFHGFANYRIGWGHWNEKGHRAAAEIIAPRLCSAAAAG